MSDEFESINSKLPDLQSVIANRLASKNAESSDIPPAGTVDPYQLMMKRKNGEPLDIDTTPAPEWPKESVQQLEDYCKRMGIVGFNCGKMHPIAALAMLKKQVGDDFTDVPMEDRVPEGYQKLGSKQTTPYSDSHQNRRILHD